MMHLTKKVRINTLWVSKDFLKPAVYDIKYTLRTEVLPNTSQEQLAEQQNVSFCIVNFFIKDYLNNTVIYSSDQRSWLEKFIPEFDNTLTILPQLTETMFLSSIHAKLNTLVLDNTVVEHIEIVDIAQDLSYNYFNDSFDYDELPEVEDWLGEFSFWKTPWYYRKDFSTFDNCAKDEEEYLSWMANQEQQEAISQMEQAYIDMIADIKGEYQKTIVEEPKEGKIIDFTKEKTKPKLKLVPKDPK